MTEKGWRAKHLGRGPPTPPRGRRTLWYPRGPWSRGDAWRKASYLALLGSTPKTSRPGAGGLHRGSSGILLQAAISISWITSKEAHIQTIKAPTCYLSMNGI